MNALTVKIFSVAIAAGLAAGAAFAASASTVTVTLAEAVTLGTTTLPAGLYQVTESATGNGDLFVFRSNNGEVAATLAMRTAEAAPDQKTEVVLTHEGGALHMDKLFIAGENTGYQFPESK
jgi:hypothetical protein